MLQRCLIALFVLALCACDGCGGSRPSVESSSAPTPPPAPSVLEGVVRLAPGAQLPHFSIEEMEKKVLDHVTRDKLPEVCSAPKNSDREPVKLTDDGLLAGVMLAASQFSSSELRAPRIHEVSIRDCRLTPSLVVAMRGDSLRIKNEVNYPFMPSFGKSTYVQTLTPGQQKDFILEQGGVKPVLCGFTAPCGRTDVIVLYHSVYAVTDAEGKFRIEDFPPDETIEINAWHPLFQEAKLSVNVPAGQTKKIELILTPAPADAPAPAAAPAAAAADTAPAATPAKPDK